MKTPIFIIASTAILGFLLISAAARPTAISQTSVDDLISYLQVFIQGNGISVSVQGKQDLILYNTYIFTETILQQCVAAKINPYKSFYLSTVKNLYEI